MQKILSLICLFALCAGCSRDDGYSQNNNQKSQNQPSDSWITTKVKASIMSESCLSASARFIHVETNDGVVTLTGNVPTRDDSRTAERLAESVDGVRSVNNRLTIGK